jgi:TRAP-type C4-dicarboxylate transport system substrate-binding protein
MRKYVTHLLATVLVPGALLFAGAFGASAEVQTRTLRFTAASNKGHPQVLGVEKFAEIVKDKSSGKITVRAFPVDRSVQIYRSSPPCREVLST